MSKFISERYKALAAYTPGEQPRDQQYIKLNTNESPYPPSRSVIDAVTKQEIEKLRLYSDPESKSLKEALAKRYGVSCENVFVSNGSDEILNFAFMIFTDNGVVFPEISYGFYKVYSELYGIKHKAIPLREDFSICADDYCSSGAMVVIANPNAPTGLALDIPEIEKIVASNKDNLVLIDEAYVDFGADSALSLLSKYDNLLVVRTFSKSRSMAGARLGFAFGSKEIIEDLEKIKYSTNPYNINRITQLTGTAALYDDDYYMQNCKKIEKTREHTSDELRKLGFEVLGSRANFIFAKSAAISGEQLYKKLKENGVLVRHFSDSKICEYNRITIGTPEEMQVFLEKVKMILGEKK